MDPRICIVHLSIFILISTADKDKILLIFYSAIKDLPAILQSLPKETLRIMLTAWLAARMIQEAEGEYFL